MTNFESTYARLKVLDLSTNFAGPYAAMILGDLGADVIKVERTPGGDDTRALPPSFEGVSTVFQSVNRNKRSVLIDIKDGDDRNKLLSLATDADVIIESFPPGVGRKLSLTYDVFREINPSVIMVSISAFGDGPEGSTLPGYDALVQAASGMMSLTGAPGESPVRIGPSVLDLTTGMWSVIGVQAALERRRQCDRGEHLKLCLLDTAMNLMCHQILGYVANNEVPAKFGSNTPSAAPYGVFPTIDDDIMIATASDPQFARLCDALGRKDLNLDPDFADISLRVRNRDRLNELICSATKTNTASYWVKQLKDHGVGVSRVNDLAQALNSAVTQERNILVGVDGSGLLQLRLPIDATARGVRRAPPALGEHNEDVFIRKQDRPETG